MNNDSALIPNDLNERQWELFKYLMSEFRKHDNKWLKIKEDIYEEMGGYFYPFISKETEWNNSHARRMITADILALKKSERLHKIILSNQNGVKIATEEEAKNELIKEKLSILKSLKRVNFQMEKMDKDQQCRLVFNTEKPIIETFIKNYGGMV